jgi:Concanavalin A-like lectin/glucanases superfamily/Bacterial Ig-like domain/Bacterial Ig domain
VAAAPASADPLPGLVAAYAFDDGSGAVLDDASGNNHLGTVNGATWTTGRHGGALSFNGTNNYVDLPSLGTFYQSGFTFEAWVQKQSATKNDVGILGTWTGSGGGPMLWVDHLATRYHLTMNSGMSNYLDSGQNPVAGQWQHLAATYDGTTARFYIDGTQVASRSVSYSIGNSDTWRIGAYGSPVGGFFDGSIDDVRIYNRALSATEVQTDMNQPVAPANAGAPTKPGNFSVTSRTQTSLSVQWSASTDDVAVTGYNVYIDGTLAGTTTGTSFTYTGLTCSTSHLLEVEATDGSSHVSDRAKQSASTRLCSAPVGLVAAYSFDDPPAATVDDVSGNGHTGTLVGAAWGPGRYGGAVDLNGTNAYVDLGPLGTFYQSAFTLEAWVKKQSTSKNDVAVVGSWNSGGPMIWVDHLATRYQLVMNNGMSNYLDSGQNPVAGQWQHLAATFDGTTARFFIDGVQVASRSVSVSIGSSNVWRIGAYGGSPTGFFDGLVDDVRIYNRALSGTELQVDMNQPVTRDLGPPSAPGTLTATPGVGQASLSWGAATDDVGVASYNVYRSTTSGFTPDAGSKIATATGTTYVDHVAAGTYYYRVAAVDAVGNVGPPSNQASATVVADVVPPTVSLTAPSAGTVSGTIAVTANASDDQSVAGVQFKLDGANLGAEATASPYSISWDTRGTVSGSHTLTAVARDAAGNTATSASVAITVTNGGVSTTGLRAAYALDEGSGSVAIDASGNNKTGTVVNGSWTQAGKYGAAVSLNGTSSEVDLPSLGTFYQSAFTLEAWVYKQSTKVDAAIVGSWNGGQGGGPMIWVDHVSGHYRLTLGGSFSNYLDSGVTPAVGHWQHVAGTWDGTTARIYIDGVLAASAPYSGSLGTSNLWRIGTYGNPAGGFFDGLIDNVRIYDRALSAAEIQTDMVSAVQPDPTPPTVTTFTPAALSAGINVGVHATARFSTAMDTSSLTSSTFQLTDSSGGAVAASISYDSATNTATLTPQTALQYGMVYTARVKGGSGGVKNLAGVAMAADVTWQFTTEASPPPILVVTSQANPFSSYLDEILRAEGVDAFTTVDESLLSPSLLSGFDVVLLGDISVSAADVSMLTAWVNAGGNLIAMRPDKQLAGLLGLTDDLTMLANAYLKVDTSTSPGAGIVDSTIQYHGSADRYSLNGATAVATLYFDAANATTNPAVTLRSVGTNGGQAAAFTYDLARSVVLTRQGNPAWAGQERDGVAGIRPSDMFYGAKAGDVQPDWLDTSKIAIPQADEQQRLLVNLITTMERDKLPLPHFWYLPRGKKAVVVMSGDDHAPSYAPGGTASNFDRFKALSPAGCVVANWECVRTTSWIFPENPLTDAQAAAYVADGFEIALHPLVASCPTSPITQAQLSAVFDQQLAAFAAKYPSVPAPVASRTHCVFWPDWVSEAKVELAHGIRMDGNYYHYPMSWIGDKPGFMNGGGFPMRFADLDGTSIDVYQLNTNMTDEGGQAYPDTAVALLDKALGPEGFYGAFGTNIHTDNPAPQGDDEAIVAAAQARGVPIVSYKQMLVWTDGRNASTIRGLSWSAGTLTFVTTVASGANGLQTMLPVQGPGGTTLTGITHGGSPVAYTVQTIKGIQYAMFDAATATYQATYS